jgi:hypothetical protein
MFDPQDLALSFSVPPWSRLGPLSAKQFRLALISPKYYLHPQADAAARHSSLWHHIVSFSNPSNANILLRIALIQGVEGRIFLTEKEHISIYSLRLDFLSVGLLNREMGGEGGDAVLTC